MCRNQRTAHGVCLLLKSGGYSSGDPKRHPALSAFHPSPVGRCALLRLRWRRSVWRRKKGGPAASPEHPAEGRSRLVCRWSTTRKLKTCGSSDGTSSIFGACMPGASLSNRGPGARRPFPPSNEGISSHGPFRRRFERLAPLYKGWGVQSSGAIPSLLDLGPFLGPGGDNA